MYEHNIGLFISDHRDYRISGAPGGRGYTARRRDSQGRPKGRRLTAPTLDELAVRIAEFEMNEPTAKAKAEAR